MSTIWKFTLETTDKQIITLPEKAKILTVQTQHEVPCFWAEVDKFAQKEEREVRIFGTGNPIDIDTRLYDYIGTYQLRNGALVFHVYIKK